MIPNSQPVQVTEVDNNYHVKIHATQKERASRIAGRRWDPNLVAWVYSKNLQTYEALKAEFQKDAEIFEIRKPKRVTTLKPAPHPTEEDDSIYQDDWKDLTQKTDNIHEQFGGISNQLTSLLEEVRILGESNTALHSKLDDHTPTETAPAPENEKDSNLDISKASDQEALGEALIQIALASTKQDQSFAKWVKQHNPVTKPRDFVSCTHEHLLNQLKAIAGEKPYNGTSFADYIYLVKDRKLVSIDRSHNVPAILFTLNSQRNIISHTAGMNPTELMNRSITYLMNTALIWQDFASEPTED